MTWTLHVEEEFSSAHANGPDGHKCNNMHGHDWLATVEVTYNKLDENGWGPDFGLIKSFIKPLDHQNLNDYFAPHGIKPSAEEIARWLYHQIWGAGYKPDFVEVNEGGANSVVYTEA